MKGDFTVGFTGTLAGMNADQLRILEIFLRQTAEYAKDQGLRPVFRHGDAEGADYQAAYTAKYLGYWIHAHPCTISRKRAYFGGNDVTEAVKDPLDRNRDIVDHSDYMLATPKETYEEVIQNGEPVRSGTWYTIRYFRDKKKKPHWIIYA